MAKLPRAYLRIPESPMQLWEYIADEFRKGRVQTLESNPRDMAIVGYVSGTMGLQQGWQYFSLLADSATASSTVVQFAVVFVGGSRQVDQRYSKRLLDKNIADFKRDFPSAVEVFREDVPASLRALTVATAGPEADAMLGARRTVLAEIDASQRRFLARYSRYAAQVGQLAVTIPGGITVSRMELVSGGWRAVVEHVGLPGMSCEIAVNAPNQMSKTAPNATPACSRR